MNQPYLHITLFVLALISGIYGAAIRNRDGATSMALAFMLLADAGAVVGGLV